MRTVAAGDFSRLSKAPLVQLATLLLAANDNAGDDDDVTAVADSAADAAGGASDSAARADERLARKCRQLVGAMRSLEPSLTDWGMFRLEHMPMA